jgi:hypothetical protein
MVNEIAAGSATKSTLRVDEICGDAADEIRSMRERTGGED